MKEFASTIKLVAVLAITIALVVIGILNLRDRLGLPPVAADGIEWVDTADGVQAKSVSQDSPLAYAVRKGDYVKAFFYVGRYDSAAATKSTPRYLEYEEVSRAETLARGRVQRLPEKDRGTTRCRRRRPVDRSRGCASPERSGESAGNARRP